MIGIAIAIVLSGGTGVMAASNNTGNNTDIGTAQQLEQLTSNNSLANASSMTSFNDTTNQTLIKHPIKPQIRLEICLDKALIFLPVYLFSLTQSDLHVVLINTN
jgi:hypothetical protein